MWLPGDTPLAAELPVHAPCLENMQMLGRAYSAWRGILAEQSAELPQYAPVTPCQPLRPRVPEPSQRIRDPRQLSLRVHDPRVVPSL